MAGWPDDETRMLRELNAQGLSRQQIADRLNHRFDNGRSSNAVIGKLLRLGVQAAPSQGRTPARRMPTLTSEERFIVDFAKEWRHATIYELAESAGYSATMVKTVVWRNLGPREIGSLADFENTATQERVRAMRSSLLEKAA